MSEARLWLLALGLRPHLGPHRFRLVLEKFGSPQAFFEAGVEERRQVGLPRVLWQQPTPREALSRAEQEVAALKSLGAGFLTWEDQAYPPLLHHLPDPPPVLFYQGRLAWREPSLAVVGSRAATSYGRRVVKEWVAEIARAEVPIVSGLAVGIDAAAHEAALAAKGYTIAVLGCGLDQNYPPANRKLALQIAQQGLLLTEFPLGTKPRPQNFPIRNRLISGLSQAVLVVEASPRSGSLITAHLAAEQGKEVLAVPGSIYSYRSHGCHQLIREGAALVDRPEQVLEALGLSTLAFKSRDEKGLKEALTLSAEENKVWEVLEVYPMHLDDIASRAGLAVSLVSGILVALELRGLVQSSPGNFFQKVVGA